MSLFLFVELSVRPTPLVLRVRSYAHRLCNEPGELVDFNEEEVRKWLFDVLATDEAAAVGELGLDGGSLQFVSQEDLRGPLPQLGQRLRFLHQVNKLLEMAKQLKTVTSTLKISFPTSASVHLLRGDAQHGLKRVTLAQFVRKRRPGSFPRSTLIHSIDMGDVTMIQGSVSAAGSSVSFESKWCLMGSHETPDVEACFVSVGKVPADVLSQGLRRGELLFPGDDVETKIAKQLERKGCSFAVTGKKFLYHEEAFACHTCWGPGVNKVICKSCREMCHEGHDIHEEVADKMFCDCGDREGGECPVECLCLGAKK